MSKNIGIFFQPKEVPEQLKKTKKNVLFVKTIWALHFPLTIEQMLPLLLGGYLAQYKHANKHKYCVLSLKHHEYEYVISP